MRVDLQGPRAIHSYMQHGYPDTHYTSWVKFKFGPISKAMPSHAFAFFPKLPSIEIWGEGGFAKTKGNTFLHAS